MSFSPALDLCEGDQWLVLATCHYRQVMQVLQELLVLFDGHDHGRWLAVLDDIFSSGGQHLHGRRLPAPRLAVISFASLASGNILRSTRPHDLRHLSPPGR